VHKALRRNGLSHTHIVRGRDAADVRGAKAHARAKVIRTVDARSCRRGHANAVLATSAVEGVEAAGPVVEVKRGQARLRILPSAMGPAG
jgi:hypothetical protein